MTEFNSTLLIAVLGIIFTIVSFYYGRSSANRQEGKQDGQILTELGYLKSSMDAIMRRLDNQDSRDREYISRITCVEQKIEQLYRHNNTSQYSEGK